MQFFSSLKLKTRLLLIVLLPLVGFMYFSIDSIIEKYAVSSEMEKMETLAELSVKLGGLAHELQKERGMSAGFLGSKGAKFSSEILVQRGGADKKATELRQKLKEIDVSGFGAEIEHAISGALKILDELRVKRDAISSLTIAPKDSFSYYTGLIENLLSIPNSAPRLRNDLEILKRSSAYAALLYNKEHTGQEPRITGTR